MARVVEKEKVLKELKAKKGKRAQDWAQSLTDFSDPRNGLNNQIVRKTRELRKIHCEKTGLKNCELRHFLLSVRKR